MNDPQSLEPTRTEPLAVVAFALATTGLFALPFVGAILGILLGLKAKRRIDASAEPVGGRQLAVAGIVLGGVGLGAATFIVTVFLGFRIF